MKPRPSTVLLVGIKGDYERALRATGTERGLEVVARDSLEDAAPIAGNLVLCAVAVGGSSDQLLHQFYAVRSVVGSAPIAMVAREVEVDAVVRLMRAGTSDVIEIPQSPSKLAERCLSWATPPDDDAPTLVGNSPAIAELREQIARVAPTDSTILITGETGTGKGLVARAVHAQSLRKGEAFVHADCACLSLNLIESELFGHERGAFTGAVARREGRFALADRGTIFLDEIGDLGAEHQTRLLRVLQDREYERIGGSKTQKMNARVIAATSRDLSEAVANEQFRPDLYFRLNVFRMHMPPLRDRRVDIRDLTASAIVSVARRLRVPIPEATEGFQRRLMRHDWPGNVRELMNVLERALIQNAGRPSLDVDALDRILDGDSSRCSAGHLPGATRAAAEVSLVAARSPSHAASRRGAAWEEIAAALIETGGNIARTARRLHMPRSTLRYWIRQYKLHEFIPKD